MTTAQVLIEKGKTEGKMEGIYETARRMYERSFDIQTIADATGLSMEEVERIVSKRE